MKNPYTPRKNKSIFDKPKFNSLKEELLYDVIEKIQLLNDKKLFLGIYNKESAHLEWLESQLKTLSKSNI